jgi:hypothetical protein
MARIISVTGGRPGCESMNSASLGLEDEGSTWLEIAMKEQDPWRLK